MLSPDENGIQCESRSRAAIIADCYSKLLGRLAEGGDIAHWHGSSLSSAKIVEEFMHCEERRRLLSFRTQIEEKLEHVSGAKILIFGAYGNGNWGDAMQPSQLFDAIEMQTGAKAFAYSELNVAGYPFPADRVVPHNPKVKYGALNAVVLDLFDALVIGGGGLLAHPHDPLWDPNWPRLIEIPYVLLSCGAASHLDPLLHNLVACARAVSGRDATSVRALSAIRKDATLCPDPILCRTPISPEGQRQGKGTAYVLRGPLTRTHEEILASLGTDDGVYAVEPGVDWPLCSLFTNLKFIHSLADMEEVVRQHQRMVTERYHAAIIALKMGAPTFGLTRADHNEEKILDLFAAFKAQKFSGRTFEEFPDTFPFENVKHHISLSVDIFNYSLKKILLLIR